MSIKPSLDGIGEEDYRFFRVFKIIVSAGRQALHFVFMWGCQKESTETIEDYLKEKKMMTNKDFKNRFDTIMQKAIKNDPSGDSYDISLIYACIRWGCDLATTQDKWQEGKENLESLCSQLKNMRNRLCHGQQLISNDAMMNEKCNEIRDLLTKIIHAAKTQYKIPDEEVVSILKEIEKQIESIMKATLGKKDLNELQKFREENKKAIKEIGKEELLEQYKCTSKIDPASFVTGKERLHVKNVFTRLDVICEDMGESYEVGYEDVLDVMTEDGSKPTVIIIEGDAGAGKTTLTKLILSDWAEGSTVFQGLEKYDLVFRAEGKKCISSYLELIHSLLPKASYKFDDDDLIHSVLKLKVLLIMDGFDELNKESEKLIKELVDKQIPRSSDCLHLLITTRPSKLIELNNILGSHRKIQTKLKGISLEKRVEFVTKLHNEMIKENLSNKDTQKLVDLLKKSQASLGEHYRLPLNLTLLTYLWASDPTKVNPETSATGLYIAFQEMIESRLENRLMGQLGVVDLSKDQCQEIVRDFERIMYQICLETLLSDSMQLSDKAEETLRQKCKDLKVPFSEMVEGFLVVEKEWTSSGYKTELTLPHKSILEFYAANHFMTRIRTKNDDKSDDDNLRHLLKERDFSSDEIETLLKKHRKEEVKSLHKICKGLLKTDQNLAKYENMFLHLTGLLAHHCPDFLNNCCEELVELLKNAAFKGAQWLNLLVEAKCNEKLAGLLASVTNLQLVIRDGHMGAAIAMFKHLEINTPIQVILENEVTYIPRLDEMLCLLSKRDCVVEIFFKHQWKNSEYGSSDDRLSNLVSDGCSERCKVTKFTGLLSTLSYLQETTTDLKIAFPTTEQAKQLLEELNDLVDHGELTSLGIHVMPEVKPHGLLPLPIIKPLKGGDCGTLWVSKVGEDWEVRCKVIRELLPDKGMFHAIMFPRSDFTAQQCTRILTRLKDLGVRVGRNGGIRFSSSSVSKDKLNPLKTLARQYFDCALYWCDEASMW